jgi:hypothetical protein
MKNVIATRMRTAACQHEDSRDLRQLELWHRMGTTSP